VGDTKGIIRVLNYSSGAPLRTLDPHKSAVSSLIYCEDSSCIISSSWDSIVNIHDELDTAKKGRSVIRNISGNKKDITGKP
jgi:WD40 repeat protein